MNPFAFASVALLAATQAPPPQPADSAVAATPRAHFAAAMDKFQNGRNARADYEAAVKDFDAAIAAGLPKAEAARAHAWKGMTYLRIGDLEKTKDKKLPWYKKGEASAKKGIQTFDGCADCHYIAASCLGRWGEQRGIMNSLFLVGDVVDGFERALEIEPGHLDASLAMGKVDEALPFFAGGDVERAEKRFREVVRRKPGHTRAMMDLAELLAKEGRETEARQWATKARDHKTPAFPGDHRKWDKARARALLARLPK